MGFTLIHHLLAPLTEVGSIAILLAIVLMAQALEISFALTLASVALLYRAQPRMRELDQELLRLDELCAPLALVVGLLSPAAEFCLAARLAAFPAPVTRDPL